MAAAHHSVPRVSRTRTQIPSWCGVLNSSKPTSKQTRTSQVLRFPQCMLAARQAPMSQPRACHRRPRKCTHLRRKTPWCRLGSAGSCSRARQDRRARGRLRAPEGTTARHTPSCLYLGTRSRSGRAGGTTRLSGCISAGTPPLSCQFGFVRENHTPYLPIFSAVSRFAFHEEFVYQRLPRVLFFLRVQSVTQQSDDGLLRRAHPSFQQLA